ncbi:MAG: GNAT family N-acetyltransferase [Chloroflexi bacterium]|nr:GNAT family N-acetyltransferase [Chloroflexota bacterium]
MPPPALSLREAARQCLNLHSPADALAGYYALHYDPGRTEIVAGEAGFLLRARTGADLFRPLMTYRAMDEAAASGLFQRGLRPGQPVIFAVPEALAGWINKHLQVADAAMVCIYELSPADYQPLINVLVTGSRAAAGLNWRSPDFAEVYVHTEPAVRGRGWGRSVVSALAGVLLRERVRLLYVVEEANSASIRLAEAVGFRDTGLRQFTGQAMLPAR